MSDTWDAVLCDLDGTLADSVDLILSSYRHTMRVHLGHELPDALWIEGLGTPLDIQLRAFARTDDESVAMKRTYREFQITVHDSMVRPFAGVSESLDWFRAQRVPLGIVTSKFREMTMRTLAICGIADRFDFIITPEDVARGKPDPEPVLAGVARVPGARASHVLFVGDAPADLRAGRAAGVRTAAALWGPFAIETLRLEQPDYLLNSPDELIRLRPGEP